MRWVRRLALWGVDYLAITAWQARGLLTARHPERLTRAGGTAAPVVLVPGIYETWTVFRILAAALHDRGHPVHPVPTLGYNRGPVEEMAARTARLVLERDLRGVVLVAHSKGGLVGKQVMLDPAVADRVVGMVAVNTPFAGSRYAVWIPVRAVRALGPKAPGILALAGQREVNARITSVYPTFDPHVPGGSALPGARNVEIPTTGHFRTLVHPQVVDAVVAEVARHAASGADAGGPPADEGAAGHG
ncbi:esterase/lipase family protein [Georgenia faecalis]|uniref:esterase/lipase family protein n=1 Tax=Georgenia faecalis TaxID=2483799 RepID=UPI000FD98879|nr:alpha/beta hydrolase [Georgenia faecalis]